MAYDPVLVEERSERIATITLNRPHVRNALNGELLDRLRDTVAAAADDPSVAVIIVTGTDPAFCAGLDMKEPPEQLEGGVPEGASPFRFFPVVDKPVIGAINGTAATAGLEIALQCTFLVASERARFADTHARVGVMPGAGMTPLLVQAVGVRRAIELSVTGRFLDAHAALAAGLVNHVVEHDELLPAARRIAMEIAAVDATAVRRLVAHYRAVTSVATLDQAYQLEGELQRSWGDKPDLRDRRQAIVTHGRSHLP